MSLIFDDISRKARAAMHRDRAAECERQADKCTDPEARQKLMEVAERWRQMANALEAPLKQPPG
jgi:hypothetical protein